MHLFMKKKITAVLFALILLFCCAMSAFAFSVEIDPNADEEQALQWNNEEVCVSENNVSEEFFTGEYTAAAEPQYACSPLSPELCEPIDEYLLFDDAEFAEITQITRIEAALADFYKKTGVQPYLMLTREAFDNGAASELLKNKYTELFGENGGHLLVLFSEPGNAGSVQTWYLAGSDAAALITYAAGERLMDHISRCSDLGFSYEDTFCRSFELAADFILYEVDGDVEEQEASTVFVPEYVTAETAFSDGEIIGGADNVQVTGNTFSFILAAILILVSLFCIFILIGAAIKKKNDK